MKTLITIIAFFTVLNINAQWTNDTDVNTLVVDSEGGDMKAIGASDGKTFVVFWKVVPAPDNYELRLQVLDVDGTQMLGNDGILISDSIPMSTWTAIWSLTIDSDDNIYVGITGTGGGEPAYVFKMNSSGNHLWGANGINVGSGFSVTILPLSTGNAIVSWFPGGESIMQKYDANGNTIWGSPKPIANSGNETVAASLFDISNEEYIMVFHSLTVGIYSTLFAQRFNMDGDPQWVDPTQLSNNTTQFNIPYYGLNIGDVVYYGYKGSHNNRFDSYLQRLNSDGTLPWGINGMDFDINETFFEMDTRIAHEPGSQYIWAICTYTTPSQSNEGEYIQKFDKDTGARLFTDNAKEIYPVSSDYEVHAGALHLVDNLPLFLLKSGFDNGATPTILSAVKLDENGDFAWPEESRPMATFAASKSRIHFTKYVINQSVAVFIEEKSVEPKIYAQNITDEILGDGGLVPSKPNIIYTNPIHDQIQIICEFAIESIIVENILGQIIFDSEFNDQSQLTINTQNWSDGLYLMTITTNNRVFKGYKIVKQ